MKWNNCLPIDEPFSDYTVTADGRVFNKDGNEMKQHPTRCGYLQVVLSHNGYTKRCSVHRLVAAAFLPNPEGKRVVNHIDGDKTNNCVSNLEWATDHENMIHAYATSLKKNSLTHSAQQAGARVTAETRSRGILVEETGEIYPSLTACSKALGVPKSSISRICNGKTKNTRGKYHFSFADEVSER